MTVGELIDKLKEYPKDMRVLRIDGSTAKNILIVMEMKPNYGSGKPDIIVLN